VAYGGWEPAQHDPRGRLEAAPRGSSAAELACSKRPAQLCKKFRAQAPPCSRIKPLRAGTPPPTKGGIKNIINHKQKKAFDEIKVLRTKGLERRADNPPPADQRRMAWVFSANDRFVNSFRGGAKTQKQ